MRQRILIIDDDLRHSQLLATYFDGQGFDSLLAADAIEMQQKRDQFHCDLLVLDVNMPGEGVAAGQGQGRHQGKREQTDGAKGHGSPGGRREYRAAGRRVGEIAHAKSFVNGT